MTIVNTRWATGPAQWGGWHLAVVVTVGLATLASPVRCAPPPDPVDEQSQGVWYTAGTMEAYARRRPDASVDPERYSCVYPGKPTVYSGPMATYCAWHRPMAIHVAARRETYFVFGNPQNRPAISRYDHVRDTFADPVVLGVNPNGDAHRNPTLLIDEQGTLYVFYGAHGHPTKVVRSRAPYDITQWVKAAPIAVPNSYPQPWQLNAGELFVSHRSLKGWCCQRSTDRAASWSDPTPVILFPDASIYLVSIAEPGPWPRKIHLAWSRMGGGTPDEVRTKALWARRYDVHYARSDDGGTTWKRSDGAPYTLPIAPDQAEKVHVSGTRGVWLNDIALDPAGAPCILFVECDVRTYEARWKFARLDKPGRWRMTDVATSDHMYDAGAIARLAPDGFQLCAPTTAIQDHEDGGAIEEWTSTDLGVTWTNTRHLTPGAALSHNHVKTVWPGGTPEFRALWSHGDSVYPPATRRVTLWYCGEALARPRPIEFPGSCVKAPVSVAEP